MLYKKIISDKGKKKLAVLIDPDKYNAQSLNEILKICGQCPVDFILIGGSLISKSVDNVVELIKSRVSIPVVLFPGSLLQISTKADAILLLSLISGRNPDFLIGNHVVAAPFLKQSGIEVIPTGYILVESGNKTSVEYMSNTVPIPSDKIDIIVATAIAGEMLGLKFIYLEAGSGAKYHIPEKVIAEVKKNISVPLIVGGGIRNQKQMKALFNAGADVIVLGNSLENSPENLLTLTEIFNKF
jgi:putative glycerol-1-phosphate prenyltransferase